MAHTNRRRGEHDEGPEREQERAAFSEFLQSARRAANLSLDEIATLTKVPGRHLRALEEGRVADLPRGLYRRSILRNYAAAVGLDPSLVVERFSQAYGMDAAFSEWAVPRAQTRPSAPPPVRSTPASAPQRPPAAAPPGKAAPQAAAAPDRTRLRIVAAAALLLLVVIAAYSLTRPESSSPDGAPVPSEMSTPQPPASTPATSGTVPDTAGLASPDNPGAGTDAVERAGAAVPAEAGQLKEDVEPGPVRTDAELVVTSNPPGARVTVDGIGWGVTPIRIQHLSPGVKRVRLTLDGYVGVERDVRVGDEGGTVTVAVTLAPRN